MPVFNNAPDIPILPDFPIPQIPFDEVLQKQQETKDLKEKRQQAINPVPSPKKIICSCCGSAFLKQSHKFYINRCSTIYKANNQYLTACKSCVDRLFEEYKKITEDEEQALHRICLHFDYYYSHQLYVDVVNDCGKFKLGEYISECNAPKNANKTYDSTLAELRVGEELIEYNLDTQADKITAAERWGNGIYTKKEIEQLEEHYQMFKKNNPNVDGNQEIFIKDLCLLHLQKLKATKKEDTKGILDFAKAYRDTFKQSGLTLVSDNNMSEETLGVTLEVISKYTPEEYYKNKKLYKDFDGIEDYWKRFVFRPLKNLILGTKEKDSEYHVKIEEQQ